jgi:hypothetical protein
VSLSLLAVGGALVLLGAAMIMIERRKRGASSTS